MQLVQVLGGVRVSPQTVVPLQAEHVAHKHCVICCTWVAAPG
jgi:hypothetical protein